MLKRSSRSAFAGGMFVFPGGRVDGDDHLHRYDAVRQGPSDEQAAQAKGFGHGVARLLGGRHPREL